VSTGRWVAEVAIPTRRQAFPCGHVTRWAGSSPTSKPQSGRATGFWRWRLDRALRRCSSSPPVDDIEGQSQSPGRAQRCTKAMNNGRAARLATVRWTGGGDGGCQPGCAQTNSAPNGCAAGIARQALYCWKIRDVAGCAAGLRPGWPWSRVTGCVGADLGRASAPSVCGTAGKPPWSTRTPWTDAAPAGNPHQTCRLWIAGQRRLQNAGAAAPGTGPGGRRPQDPGGPAGSWPLSRYWLIGPEPRATRGWNRLAPRPSSSMLSQGVGEAWRKRNLEQAASLQLPPLPETAKLGSRLLAVQSAGNAPTCATNPGPASA